ncbi:hypothetical protein SARC_08102 [Sphaeroforma arctica JP610]|uniref:OsmC-like protein n=1 Tax=Sphaeroforma arctica JP610 TaxID=667725 RepID=A0A0L0FUA6_9EUKA|nr:hypothetical protein SARC_08102 [Sphaeroforma arctica JP610]KNC79508.1 hypothetical protein SARC_08102 [Sphaeroforma arctica JP610]|eukprot:XP_014153410.1 hypothetical protein SARC_08102 [Sphaeroforma arctica JP610]
MFASSKTVSGIARASFIGARIALPVSARMVNHSLLRSKTSYSKELTGPMAKPMKGTARATAESFDDYYTEVKTGSGYNVVVDHLPESKGGKGPSPLEYALTSLAGCKTSAFKTLAKEAGFKIDNIQYKMSANFDPRGYNGGMTYAGFTHIKLDAKIKTSLTGEELKEAAEEVAHRCIIAATFEKAGVEMDVTWTKVE